VIYGTPNISSNITPMISIRNHFLYPSSYLPNIGVTIQFMKKHLPCLIGVHYMAHCTNLIIVYFQRSKPFWLLCSTILHNLKQSFKALFYGKNIKIHCVFVFFKILFPLHYKSSIKLENSWL
jgi:hypothetical protein